MTPFTDSIGEFAPDGTIKTEARVCAVTGIPVLMQHHTLIMLGKTSYFVRVVSQRASQLTDDVQAELLATLAPAKPAAKKSAEAAKEG